MNGSPARIDDGSDLPSGAPVILITPDLGDGREPEYRIRENYAEAIADAGGVALFLSFEPAFLTKALTVADGIVIAGAIPGAEVSRKRVDFEKTLIEIALTRKIPLLGICHGMQLIGETLGGTVHRDDPAFLAEVTAHIPQPIPSSIAHEIVIAPASRLASLTGVTRAAVNSLHRHVLAEGGRFSVAARAPDGVVEAIEADGEGFCLGVQWHPEYRLSQLDRRLLAGFVAECARAARLPVGSERPAIAMDGA